MTNAAARRCCVVAAAVFLVAACDGSHERERRATVTPADPARLAAARPLLPAASTLAAAIAEGRSPCNSPVPGYPGCERDHGQLLLLASLRHGGAGSRVDGLLWVPERRRARLGMAFWHFDSLGTALGAGWYRVVAISHVD